MKGWIKFPGLCISSNKLLSYNQELCGKGDRFMNSTTNTANAAENKMGIMPVRKLLVNMSLPMMCSMLVQAMYNVVDSVFVSHVSEDALTAVSLAFPLQSLIIAISAGTGVGVNALVSRALGEKKRDEADKVALHGIFLSFLSYIASG